MAFLRWNSARTGIIQAYWLNIWISTWSVVVIVLEIHEDVVGIDEAHQRRKEGARYCQDEDILCEATLPIDIIPLDVDIDDDRDEDRV